MDKKSSNQKLRKSFVEADLQYDEKVLEISLLYDLYGKLLTDKKRMVMELYHENDLSLSEIAEEQGVSRAAVHDALKSAERSLREYEKKLGLLAAYKERRELVQNLRKELTSVLSNSETNSTGSAGRTDQSINPNRINKLLSKLED